MGRGIPLPISAYFFLVTFFLEGRPFLTVLTFLRRVAFFLVTDFLVAFFLVAMKIPPTMLQESSS